MLIIGFVRMTHFRLHIHMDINVNYFIQHEATMRWAVLVLWSGLISPLTPPATQLIEVRCQLKLNHNFWSSSCRLRYNYLCLHRRRRERE